MNLRIDWIKTFELSEGVPTGRWQWSCESQYGSYRYPGIWLNADAVAPPPGISDAQAEARMDAQA
jgi:hypothetical protein